MYPGCGAYLPGQTRSFLRAELNLLFSPSLNPPDEWLGGRAAGWAAWGQLGSLTLTFPLPAPAPLSRDLEQANELQSPSVLLCQIGILVPVHWAVARVGWQHLVQP